MWKLVDVTLISYLGYISLILMLPFGTKQLDYKVPLHKERNRVHRAAEIGGVRCCHWGLHDFSGTVCIS